MSGDAATQITLGEEGGCAHVQRRWSYCIYYKREPSSSQQKQIRLWSSKRGKEKVKNFEVRREKQNYAHGIGKRHMLQRIF